ncbi:hypothetical protein AM596_15075 [Clostridium perfringens CP4]|jgi:hypothetical protein|uniref:hypothetical protein n=1 Tax=Clostridium perfringens TaxID=1502 RepID=UPI000707EDCC|nr:hypothetical protein [Clostridium perfringens]KQC91354.1 hypothetical protein AM596_15075 [Clostridium perfringens CP4]
MCKFKVYQANKNIRGTCVNIPLRKDNKIFAKEVLANPKIRMKHTLIVYTAMGIHFYKPSDFRISKNQKLNNKIMGVDR